MNNNEKKISAKPLGKRAYGSIPHLPTSRLGPGDHFISEGQAVIATEKKRDKHDFIIVQEKLDGSNVSVAKINGDIISLTRAGYTALSSPYKQHHYFAQWVKKNEKRFAELLNEGERACGEWLALAHGTRYDLMHEPFVVFDLITGKKRVPYLEFSRRCLNFITPRVLSIGEPYSIDQMKQVIQMSGHGAIDEVEGAIWRVERKGEVDFLAKFVQHHKQDGKYFTEVTGLPEVWNIDISAYEAQPF